MPVMIDFLFDVFLSHSLQDRDVAYEIAQRLRGDGLRVWFEDWEIRTGIREAIRAKKIEEGLEHSRVLVLCLSVHAFGPDWGQLEAGTFRFRDPLNKERRFISLRLDDTPIHNPLAPFLFIDWLPHDREKEYSKLLETCRPRPKAQVVETEVAREHRAEKAVHLKGREVWEFNACAFGLDGRHVLLGDLKNLELWDVEAGSSLRTLEGHSSQVGSVAWSRNNKLALSGSDDGTVRIWDLHSGSSRALPGHKQTVRDVAWRADQRCVISVGDDMTVRIWDVETGRGLSVLKGHTSPVWSVAWCPDNRRVIAGGEDGTMRLWDAQDERCMRVLEGHTDVVRSLAWGNDYRHVLSGSNDKTVRLWDMETGRCLRVLKGHTNVTKALAWCADRQHVLSGSYDKTLRLWDLETGRCIIVLDDHPRSIIGVTVSADQRHAFSGDRGGNIRIWALSRFLEEARALESHGPPSLLAQSDQVQYTNAKVLLVGESGAGKTGLSKRLAFNEWQPSDSTVGVWATQWKLPVSSADGAEREIWLWDFGGQADQRLIHQLYMDETALAILVFDGQKDDLFETLDQWDRDLGRAARTSLSKLLVAGRADAGGLRVSRAQIEKFREERGYLAFLETSAKANICCDELRQAILGGIRWEDIPWRSSPLLFKRLKEEIVRLKDTGRVLMRLNELREALALRLSEEGVHFSDEELEAVLGLLAGPGVVWKLKFGSWVLLQPERINAYAQAVIQTMREDKHERGCLLEERVLNGALTYHSSVARLDADEERFVLLAMHQILVERGLCLREQTDKGPLLVLPSYYRRKRPELVGHPAVLVTYRFNGFLDEVYATLVVRLHHTDSFPQDQLWHYAADFKTLTGKKLGVKLTRRAEGMGELDVYFDPAIPVEEKIIFSKYIHEHLLENGKGVERLRQFVCPHCGTPVGNREVAMRKLEEGKENIICIDCEKRIPLWDQMEELFASMEMKQRVHHLQQQSAIVLDSESKERALVGDVISTVALAGQISREFSVSDHGIDMEIEFKSDVGEATGRKLYLQLKSGDSYLHKRTREGKEIFTIKKERHARHWMEQAFPVLLVIRSSEGQVRWMEVRDWLKRASDDGRKPVKQIVFEGERFDVMSVRRWRDRVLSAKSAR